MARVADGSVEATLAAVFVLPAGVLREGEAREGTSEAVERIVVIYRRGCLMAMLGKAWRV